jgi:predicted nucleic acid-binding protein
LTLYLDSSALVKRYIREDGSDEVREAMAAAPRWSSCRHGFVEAVRAVGLKAGEPGAKRVRNEWRTCSVIELDQDLAERAARLAIETGLRTLDALHLAAALSMSVPELIFATWDSRLHGAARDHRLRTLPATLG